jgi:hypothetical protein
VREVDACITWRSDCIGGVMEVTFDLLNGNVLIEGINISLTADGEIIQKFTGFHKFSSTSQTTQSEYRSCNKFTTLSSSVDLIVAVEKLRIVSICILFEWIVFFDRTLLESKIIRRFEKKYGETIREVSSTTGEVGKFLWGDAFFSYDPHYGSLLLCFTYKPVQT